MFSTIVFTISAALIISLYLLLKERAPERLSFILKILAIAYPVIGVIRFLFADSFVEVVFDMQDPYESFMRWAYYIGYAVLPTAVFFENRLLRNIASVFSLPVAIVYTVSFEHTMQYFLAEGGGGIMLPDGLRYAYHVLELCLAITVPIIMMLSTGHMIRLDSVREPLSVLGAVPLIMILMMPAYLPQSTVGYSNISAGSFSSLHLGWIGFLFLEIIGIYFFFKKRSYTDKYTLLVFITIAQFFHTNSIFLRGFTLSRLPLQLCSIAAFFYIIAIVFKKKPLLDFCYLVNIVGGVVAIVLADFSDTALAFWNIHYIHEHTFVMLVPILALTLGFSPKIDRSSLKNAIIIFSIYFISSFILGSVINAVSPEEGYPVNFFYMFDLDRALSYVPFVGFAGAIHIVWGEFEMYPILVGIIYAIFTLLIVGFYFFTRGIYRLRDFLSSRHNTASVRENTVN